MARRAHGEACHTVRFVSSFTGAEKPRRIEGTGREATFTNLKLAEAPESLSTCVCARRGGRPMRA